MTRYVSILPFAVLSTSFSMDSPPRPGSTAKPLKRRLLPAASSILLTLVIPQLLILQLVMPPPSSAQTPTIPEGGQFLVNTYTTSSQTDPSVAVHPEGDFVVVWRSAGSDGGDTSSDSVQGQRYASGGAPLGGQFQVNTYTTGFQSGPSVAVDREGDFVVVWQSSGSDNGDTAARSVQGQRFRVTADLGDRVFLDEDFDGRQDPSEPGLPGIVVHLRDGLGDLLNSLETDDQGEFLFQPKIALQGVADQFFLEFEAPLFASFTAVDVGADDTIDSDADVVFGQTNTIEISSAGENHLDLDAGLIPMTFAIGDRVWRDANDDGVQQVSEDGVSGITIRLLDATDVEVASTTTDSEGLFSFVGLGDGTYSIEAGSPADSEFVLQDVGPDDEIDSNVDPLTGRSAPFLYGANTISRNHDVGLKFLPLIFTDGFESGDTSRWSSSTPMP